ncbi:FAD-dependent oxidoreductase [Caulobacter segnis]|uniref:tRNA 5-methylaminomethyl-2-thiouridine biosynthesis bifunctional protein MnmC n=2 Tax=Caulobacter segnis TaxID=88688 RepID=D5VNG6_CAUST|nr:tRNA (5-methylaminomethyl-2-thiouridine)(34)-methyltransferase MnmD [Caulobacter segnis]ADG12039.1 tRNA U-34 5-methylaminomethyl-2-thiouridine biosynthesis protein MnmC [Caulobacter segnis ATCC 21756]AVQ03651.1 FAD-dependent oxidoreductase [Caulobacter segnis]
MDPTAPSSPLVWREDGLPQSSLYGDVYFSSVDGLAETRAVFLQGCGLPERFTGRRDFVVGELGFGSGLNIAALLDLWRREKPEGARLRIFSIEAHPLERDEAARILAHWPELGEAAEALLGAWPGRARGFHRVDLPGFDAVLDLAVMDVVEALEAWDGAADAWFLDGFSPALNPAMWREEVLAAVAARSAPGARAATFTVAGAVRRGLQAAGFDIAKRPGFGRKRERLEAWLPGGRVVPSRPQSLAIIGGGIAGAALARAARAEGLRVTVIDDPDGVAASGNPAGLVTPALDAGGGPRAALYAQALARATALYAATPGAVVAREVLQLANGERDPARFAAVALQDIFEPGAMTPLDPAETQRRLGEAAPALAMGSAQVVAPPTIRAAWIGETLAAQVARLERDPKGWRLLDPAGVEILRADAVVLAGGAASPALDPTLPLRPVRGQASWTSGVSPSAPAAFGGYAIPTRDGVLFGATHDRDETAVDVRAEDHARNLATLAKGLPRLAEQLAGGAFEGRAALRATVPDHLPLAGARADGLWLLTGLGSRGLCLAPLLAEHVIASLLGLPSPLPRQLSHPVNPGRFDSLAEAARV